MASQNSSPFQINIPQGLGFSQILVDSIASFILFEVTFPVFRCHLEPAAAVGAVPKEMAVKESGDGDWRSQFVKFIEYRDIFLSRSTTRHQEIEILDMTLIYFIGSTCGGEAEEFVVGMNHFPNTKRVQQRCTEGAHTRFCNQD